MEIHFRLAVMCFLSKILTLLTYTFFITLIKGLLQYDADRQGALQHYTMPDQPAEPEPEGQRGNVPNPSNTPVLPASDMGIYKPTYADLRKGERGLSQNLPNIHGVI